MHDGEELAAEAEAGVGFGQGPLPAPLTQVLAVPFEHDDPAVAVPVGDVDFAVRGVHRDVGRPVQQGVAAVGGGPVDRPVGGVKVALLADLQQQGLQASSPRRRPWSSAWVWTGSSLDRQLAWGAH